MADNDKIKAEIEAKKKRLAELKAKRAAKAAASAAPPPAAAARAAPPPAAASRAPARAAAAGSDDVLSQVNSLLGGPGGPREPATLSSTNSIEVHSIAPLERHVYDIGSQCDLGGSLTGKSAELEQELRKESEMLRQKEAKMKVLMDQLKNDKIKYDQLRDEERLKEPSELTPQEQKSVLESQSFQDFFARSTRMMERALNQSSYDITINYADNDEDDGDVKTAACVQSHTFRDKRTSHRPITSLDFSSKYPELLLASYAGQDDPMSFDPDGTVLVWNLHMANRPEYYFTCNSAVLNAQFHPSNPKLVVASCASGQIVIWDTREKNTPINRTSLSNGHTHPCYALATVPVVNRLHNIVSVSTDGHLCVWSDNNLHDPSTELQLKFKDGKEEITCNSFDFPSRNNNSIVLGSDEGYVYKARIYDKEGIYEAQQAHDAPITNVQFHPSHKNNNLSDLYLTSSYDWTVKLWSNTSARALYTFESAKDYVFDARWSPVHPALFAMGDGTGKLDLWNINNDTDVPAFTTSVDDVSPTGDKAAICRVQWSDDGSNIAVGTSTGSVHVYSVDSKMARPGDDDTSVLYEKIQNRLTSSSL
mmetsp:Transcript_15359/g.30191  ORF Transcript_15359/g.30191 Transcript_15359/m.30191 type:complete len:592 (+) Transcript_15359:33-1808(+)|eukprot:CAMPEP_0175138486 /NCGR_PEP_ID=MMETSP0087-20121206/10380_1 /TAXON_ID=136419 /ORGANISM="Unknown Unknown, Strain D1" /LENGTH=591 /DNA_ID=CAMNT_0016421403 /DNA_START=28 /DNA_END=1803 /DNA_ORIENTATION=+